MTGRPKISSSESQTGVEGENVNINCAAVVIPEYKSIVWTYHDSVLEDSKYSSLCIVCILVVHLCIQSLSRVCILLILMSITHDIFCTYAHLVGNNRQHAFTFSRRKVFKKFHENTILLILLSKCNLYFIINKTFIFHVTLNVSPMYVISQIFC